MRIPFLENHKYEFLTKIEAEKTSKTRWKCGNGWSRKWLPSKPSRISGLLGFRSWWHFALEWRRKLGLNQRLIKNRLRKCGPISFHYYMFSPCEILRSFPFQIFRLIHTSLPELDKLIIEIPLIEPSSHRLEFDRVESLGLNSMEIEKPISPSYAPSLWRHFWGNDVITRGA